MVLDGVAEIKKIAKKFFLDLKTAFYAFYAFYASLCIQHSVVRPNKFSNHNTIQHF